MIKIFSNVNIYLLSLLSFFLSMHHVSDRRILNLGVLPIISYAKVSQPNIYLQTVNLIANIFSLTSSYPDFRLCRIIVYVMDHNFAYGVLEQFQSSGLGDYVTNCFVKTMGSEIYVSADISMLNWLQSKL